LRKLAAAVLAVPVLATFYLPLLLRRSVAARIGIVVALGAVVTVAGFGFAAPSPITATLPLPPVVPLSNEAFTSTIAAGAELDEAVTISFSAPMDPTSVEASLAVEPLTAVALDWDASRTRVTIRPKARWAAGTYHTITVRPGALAETGRPMAVPARSVFLTREATTATIEPTALEGDRASVGTAFRIAFNQPVEIGEVRRALVTTPNVRGTLDVVPGAAEGSVFLFTPSEPLVAGTAYTLRLDGLEDASGAALATSPQVAITTTEAPAVVRFRPRSKTSNVDRSATLSVRFTQPMDQASTKAAFAVTAGGKAVAGSVSFAEKDTVLVFKPSSPMPYGAEVQMLVKETAVSAAGAPLAAASSVRIRIEAKPVPPASPSSSGGSTVGSGGAVGGGSWGAVETYYLNLMNCTRTGGWVTSSGRCNSPGGRNVAALKLDAGISSKVARPYAKRLATSGACSHFIGGNPGNRLSAAGYTSYIWAENLGCRSGDPYKAVLGSHLYFQSEHSYSGGHWVNMMNGKYDRVGIGVWVSGGRVRLVVDFYHPR
jgi:uncharacterized protein YkwD